MTEHETRKRLGQQLSRARRSRNWQLSQVAHRTGRANSRISEMENGATNSTVDMLADAGDALGMSLVFIPNDRLEEVLKLIGEPQVQPPVPTGPAPSVFDEVFVDDAIEDKEEPSYARPK